MAAELSILQCEDVRARDLCHVRGMPRSLSAAAGLSLVCETPHWRVSWQESDWLGPVELYCGGVSIAPGMGRLTAGSDHLGAFVCAEIDGLAAPLRASVRAYRDVSVLVFRLETNAELRAFGGGAFADPSLAWPALRPTDRAAGGVAPGARTYGHQYAEFALPVTGDDTATGFIFAPHRPPVVEPLLFLAPDGRTLLLAPLDHFHEQIIAVPADRERACEGIRCGWHGDLAEVPSGFSSELALWAAPSPRAAIDAWATELRRRHGTARRGRYADDGVGKLSYWTDNGAVYYYRTAPGRDYTATLEAVVQDLHSKGVPVCSVQLDSWFYPHAISRQVGPEGAPLVPPSGMVRWEPRDDLFPHGFSDLRRRLAGLPLILHSRHFSRLSPYWRDHACWQDGEYAHPCAGDLFERLMESAAAWGALTYEQDWMVESFLGVRGLRVAPGRARAWQEGLDCAAARRGMTLQWCMSTPADFMQAVSLANLTSIRTSGDYRYLFDNGLNWMWFLHVNALARALGLTPYKDVFISHGKTANTAGEAYAEVESLLASLSSGPVGIGDEIGCTDRNLVLRTCREDGVLVKPDVPIAALDRCFVHNAFLEPEPLIGETYSEHPAGRWWYVAVFNACRTKQTIDYRVALSDLGPSAPRGPVIAFDWRRRTCVRLEPDGGWDGSLPWQDWEYRVLCPLLLGETAVFGDVSKYASAGDRRIAAIRAVDGKVTFDVFGVPGTVAEISGWSTRPLRGVSERDASGMWRLRLHLEAPVASVSLGA
jgi:hypothetical protein